MNDTDNTAVEETQAEPQVQEQAVAPEDDVSGFEVTTSDQGAVNEDSQDQEQASSDQASQDETQAQDAAEKQPRKSRAQRRIDSIVAERENAKQEVERLKKELASYQAKKEPEREKTQGDFDTYSEYLDYLDSLEDEPEQVESKEPEQDKQDKKEPEQDNEKEPELTHEQSIAHAQVLEQFDLADDKPSDFNEVVSRKDLAITPEMLQGLAQCDNAAKVAYHLGSNPDVAKDIASSSVGDQITAIVNLEKTLSSAGSSPQKETPQKRLSSAPDPISPVGGTHDATPRPLHEVSFSEYEARMNAREQADAGGGW